MKSIILSLFWALFAHAEFTLIDDFQNYETDGELTAKSFWVSEDSSTKTVSDPKNKENQVLKLYPEGKVTWLNLTKPIPEGVTGTLFFRVLLPTDQNDLSIGLSADLSPRANKFKSFETQLRINGEALEARNGKQFSSLKTAEEKIPSITKSWFKIWIVADNEKDHYRVFYQNESQESFQIRKELLATEELRFRNGTNSPLTTLFLNFVAKGDLKENSVYLDDIYVDELKINLIDPSAEKCCDDTVDAMSGTPLFNGTDLTGWKLRGGNDLSEWSVINATEQSDAYIEGKTKTGKNSFLGTERNDYKNFDLKFECMVDYPFNSGLQFRSVVAGKDVKGTQLEIDGNDHPKGLEQSPGNKYRGQTGGIYGQGLGGWIYGWSGYNGINGGPKATGDVKSPGDLKKRSLVERDHFKNNQWISVRLRAIGPNVKTWVNGALCTDHVITNPKVPQKGFFAIQLHAGYPNGRRVRVKNMIIREL